MKTFANLEQALTTYNAWREKPLTDEERETMETLPMPYVFADECAYERLS